MTYLIKEATLEFSSQLGAVGVTEFAIAVHLTVPELPSVFMTLSPGEGTFTIHLITGKFTLVLATICKHSCTLAMFFVSGPLTLIFRHDTVLVRLAREQLEAMSMAHHLELALTLLSCQRFYFGLVCWGTCSDQLTIRPTNKCDLTIVHGPIFWITKALVFNLFILCGHTTIDLGSRITSLIGRYLGL